MDIDDPRLIGGSVFPQTKIIDPPHPMMASFIGSTGGITLRQYYAGLAMQGLIAYNGVKALDEAQIALAVMMADDLIGALKVISCD